MVLEYCLGRRYGPGGGVLSWVGVWPSRGYDPAGMVPGEALPQVDK